MADPWNTGEAIIAPDETTAEVSKDGRNPPNGAWGCGSWQWVVEADAGAGLGLYGRDYAGCEALICNCSQGLRTVFFNTMAEADGSLVPLVAGVPPGSSSAPPK